MTRNKIPDDIQNFYIQHEGFIGVFDDELKEDDYEDVERKVEQNSIAPTINQPLIVKKLTR